MQNKQARVSLFDLAVNRALKYALSLHLPLNDKAQLQAKLEPWYTKTRFVYRIPLLDIMDCLESYPEGTFFWSGGQAGHWQEGKNPSP